MQYSPNLQSVRVWEPDISQNGSFQQVILHFMKICLPFLIFRAFCVALPWLQSEDFSPRLIPTTLTFVRAPVPAFIILPRSPCVACAYG